MNRGNGVFAHQVSTLVEAVQQDFCFNLGIAQGGVVFDELRVVRDELIHGFGSAGEVAAR